MSYSTKNYTEQGGEKTVIGGTLEIKEEAKIIGFPDFSIPVATKTKLGGIKAEVKSETDTVEVKIGGDARLYVPAYPIIEEPLLAENQKDSTAENIEGLVTDFNALLNKLKAAGLMESDTEDNS